MMFTAFSRGGGKGNDFLLFRRGRDILLFRFRSAFCFFAGEGGLCFFTGGAFSRGGILLSRGGGHPLFDVGRAFCFFAGWHSAFSRWGAFCFLALGGILLFVIHTRAVVTITMVPTTNASLDDNSRLNHSFRAGLPLTQNSATTRHHRICLQQDRLK